MQTESWESIRARILARDGNRCTVGRMLGGACSHQLHVHHLIPRDEGGTDEDDNLVTACARHHPMLEAMRRAIVDRRERLERSHWRRCHRHHRTREAREACERRLNRDRRRSPV
jgi:hypothetical protein